MNTNLQNNTIEALTLQMELIMKELNKLKASNQVTLNPQGMEKEMETVNRELCVTVEPTYEENYAKDIRPIDYSKTGLEGVNNATKEETILRLKQDLRDKLYDCGIENIVETCEEFDTDILHSYLITLMCANGTYQPESTNLEVLKREEIIQAIDEISFENFKVAMKNKGFEVKPPSKAQLDKLKELGYVGKELKTSMGASKLIESVVGKSSNEPSAKQIERINALIDKLGYQGEDYDYSTKFKASKVIGELQAIADDTFGIEKASKEQLEYFGRLMKACGKKLTKKLKEEAHKWNKKEISEKINELRALVPDVASEGQVKYLVNLHQRLMVSYNIDELKKLTKNRATDLIDKLNREVLYMETRRYQSSLTMKDITGMTSIQVTDMLKKIQADRKDQNAK